MLNERRGAGIFIKSRLICHERKDLIKMFQKNVTEIATVDLDCGKIRKNHSVNLFTTKTDKEVFRKIGRKSFHIYLSSNITIICGGFNIDLLDDTDKNESILYELLNCKTCIDNIITNAY